jgi:hypothetical protein
MPKINYRGTLEQRFWKKVNKKGEDECWEWLAIKDKKGYGLFKTATSRRASRFSYELHKGEIPKGMLVCHTCDNPPCVNPKHLWIGTNSDNMQDMMKKGRRPDRTGRHNKSNVGENNKSSKLTQKQVDEIREKYIPYFYGFKKLAKEYNVSLQNIYLIIKNKSWRIYK